MLTKDGRTVALRPVRVEDAATMIRAVDAVAREGRWFLRGSFDLTIEEETEYIAGLGPEKGAMIVAEVEDEIVGWVTIGRGRAEFVRHTAELGLGVARDYRGVGIGAALMKEAIAWARSTGIEKLCLGVRADNVVARSLYEKMGFIQEGYQQRHIKTPEGYEDILLMARFL